MEIRAGIINFAFILLVLPSQVHPSYPYGNPTNIKHPAARPRAPHDPMSRALFDDMAYAGGGVNGALRWRDLALDVLLPIDHKKEEAERAALARKMASGSNTNNNPAPQNHAPGAGPQVGQGPNDEDDDDEDESGDSEEGSMEDDEDDDEDDDDMNENSENYNGSYDE